MKIVTLLYFSATTTTGQCAEIVGEALGLPVVKAVNIADDPSVLVSPFSEDEVVVVAAPVYGGRLPSMVAESFRRLEGNGAIAIAMVVYGNRDYDDALLELTDILAERGFNIIGAAAFIGQHSIFPKVGADRPDATDRNRLELFGKLCRERLSSPGPYTEISVKGSRPYKKYTGVPVHPACDPRKCGRCGVCAELCPAGAINPDDPTATDVLKCISCGRCIHVCTRKARSYSGLKYNLLGKVFVAGFSKRKEPEWYVAK